MNTTTTSYVVVPKKVPEWSKIEYLLQLSLGTSTAVIKNMWSVSKAQLNLNFERKVSKSKMLTITSFIDTASFDKNMSIDHIINHGFQFPPEGKMFSTGFFKLEKPHSAAYRVLLCKVAVGKSLCLPVKSNKVENLRITKKDLETDVFESVFLKYEDEQENSVYKYDYVVYDTDQVHPEYLIDFYFDETKETNLKIPNCDNDGCGEIATLFCINDKVNLCGKCNEEIHERGGLIAKHHEVVPIEKKPKNFGMCSSHPETKNQFFCHKCKTTLCIYCKIKGSHSSGEFANHQLLNIEEAYDQAVNEADFIDPLIEKHKASIRSKLQELDEKISEINENARSVENDLYDVLEKALSALQAQTQKKLNILLADQMELRRQYEEIQWAESFLKYQLEVLNPHHYLTSWFRHLERKNELMSTREIEIGKVAADLKKIGSITVTTDAALKKSEGTKVDADIDISVSRNMMKQVGRKPGESFITPNKQNTLDNSVYLPPAKKKDTNSKIMGMAEDKNSSFNNWGEMFHSKGIEKLESRKGDGTYNFDSTNSFTSEPHERYARIKDKYDESMVSNMAMNLFKSSEILLDGQSDGKLIYFSISLLDENLYELKKRETFKSGDYNVEKITMLFEEDPYPSIFLFQVGKGKDSKIFGGFASQSWGEKKNHFGDENSFLFSLTEKTKFIPNKSPPDDKKTYLWHNTHSLSWGYTDLVLQSDGWWTSEVECNYTCGLELTPTQKKTYLAGKEKFKPEVLEIWTLKPMKNIGRAR